MDVFTPGEASKRCNLDELHTNMEDVCVASEEEILESGDISKGGMAAENVPHDRLNGDASTVIDPQTIM